VYYNSFSLYAVPLLATLVAYFRMELEELNGWKITKGWQGVLLLISEINVSFSQFSE